MVDRREGTSFWFFGAGFVYVWKAMLDGYVMHGATSWLAQVLAPILVFLCWRQFSPCRSRLLSVWLVAAIGTVCSYIAVALDQDSLIIGLLASFGIAAVCPMMLLLWSEVYASLNMFRAGVAISCSYIFGMLCFAAIGLLSPMIRPGLICVLPLASSLCFAKCASCVSLERVSGEKRTLKEENAIGSANHSRRLKSAFSQKIIVVTALVSFAAGVNRASTTNTIDLMAASIAGVVMLVASVLALRRFNVYMLYRFLFPLMILCLLSGVVDVAGSIFSLLGINMCYAFGMMVMTLFLCNTSHRFGEPAVRISAVGRIFTSVSFVLGAMLASWLQGTLLVFDYKIIVYALTIAGVVLATFFWIAGDEVLYGNRELFEEDKADGLKDVGECDEEARAIKASAYCGNDAAGSDGRDRSNGKSVSELLEKVIEEKCDIITEQYHLSPREGEVLVMLARGYSARLIERELVISQNTVKTHVKRIYTKLGIHSRDELSLLIDSVAEIDCY